MKVMLELADVRRLQSFLRGLKNMKLTDIETRAIYWRAELDSAVQRGGAVESLHRERRERASTQIYLDDGKKRQDQQDLQE